MKLVVSPCMTCGNASLSCLCFGAGGRPLITSGRASACVRAKYTTAATLSRVWTRFEVVRQTKSLPFRRPTLLSGNRNDESRRTGEVKRGDKRSWSALFGCEERAHACARRARPGVRGRVMCPCVQDQQDFVKGCYRSVTIPLAVIMALTCGNAVSTTFTGYLV